MTVMHVPWRSGRMWLGTLCLLLLSVILGLSALSAGAAPQGVSRAHPHSGAVAALGAAAPVRAAQARAPKLTAVVHTTHGPVRGLKVTADGYPVYETFFGIRYGQSTAGANRWLPPKPANWKHVFDATQFGPSPSRASSMARALPTRR